MIVNHALSEYIISMAFYHLKALRFLQTRNELKNIATVPMKVNEFFVSVFSIEKRD